MHAHFRNTFADGIAVAEIAEPSATQARQDPRLSLGVRQRRQPRVELC
jgi:hypothetical protein